MQIPKGLIRIRISKKNRQHNGKKKGTNNDLQNMHIKLKMDVYISVVIRFHFNMYEDMHHNTSRRLRGDMIEVYKIIQGHYDPEASTIIKLMNDTEQRFSTRTNSKKVVYNRANTNIRKKLLQH